VRMEEITVCRANMELWCCKRSASQHLLIHEPLVVVFVKLRLETRVRTIIGASPFPDVANHLMTAVCILAFGKSSNGRHCPKPVFKKIAGRSLNWFIAPRKQTPIVRVWSKAGRFFPFSFGG